MCHPQIRKAKGWSPNKRLRLVVLGRELFDDDVLTAAQAPVLHCITQDEDSSAEHSRRASHAHASSLQRPSFDWVCLLTRHAYSSHIHGCLFVSNHHGVTNSVSACNMPFLAT